jgi:hypothetical protein
VLRGRRSVLQPNHGVVGLGRLIEISCADQQAQSSTKKIQE